MVDTSNIKGGGVSKASAADPAKSFRLAETQAQAYLNALGNLDSIFRNYPDELRRLSRRRTDLERIMTGARSLASSAGYSSASPLMVAADAQMKGAVTVAASLAADVELATSKTEELVEVMRNSAAGQALSAAGDRIAAAAVPAAIFGGFAYGTLMLGVLGAGAVYLWFTYGSGAKKLLRAVKK